MAADGVSVKVRGIYATALTALFLDRGLRIVGATAPIRARFGLGCEEETPDVSVYDTGDHRGVCLEGGREAVACVADLLRREFPHILQHVRRTADLTSGSGRRLSWEDFVRQAQECLVLEFTLDVRLALDAWRARVTPTVRFHHHLKIVDPARVDAAEAGLVASGEPLAQLAEALKHDLIYRHYTPDKLLTVHHVKPGQEGHTFRGRIVDFRPGEYLRLARRFRRGGRYDGLGTPKEEGDYGYFEVAEGAWVARRSYFGARGEDKGVIYNVNTPAELYPGAVRYVDLEIDVVRHPDGRVEVVDGAALEAGLKQGLFTPALAERAREVARRVAAELERGTDAYPEVLRATVT
ncbi:MAG: DUF402 domain-containing protein [Desulfotomaculales bacterium]